MHKIKSNTGRPRSKNKRTIISEVYLSPEEAATLITAARNLGVPYLSTFIRAAAQAYVFKRSNLTDKRISLMIAYFGSITIDINDIYELSLPSHVPEEIHILAREAKQKAAELHKILSNTHKDLPYDQ